MYLQSNYRNRVRQTIAYDIIVRSSHTTHAVRRVASSAADVVNFANQEKLRIFQRAFLGILSLTDTAAIPDLGFDFVSLATDTLGALSQRVATTVQSHVRQISMRFASTNAIAATRMGKN